MSDERSFNGVKVFSVTLANERQRIGERISAWLAASPHLRVVDKAVVQSSDHGFHCLSLVLFFVEDLAAPPTG